MHVRRIHGEIATGILTGAIGCAAMLGANELGFGWDEGAPEAGYFPFHVGLLLVAASAWNIGAAIVRARGTPDASGEEEPFLDGERLGRIAHFVVPMGLFVVVTIWLGLYVGTVLYIAWNVWRHGGRRSWLALGVGIAFAVALYLIFEVGFRVPLLKGPLEPLLGIH